MKNINLKVLGVWLILRIFPRIENSQNSDMAGVKSSLHISERFGHQKAQHLQHV